MKLKRQFTFHEEEQEVTIWQLLHRYISRLILEVFGGAGAIWGFSEAVGLRTDATVWFWRPTALTIGFLFFLRLAYQLFKELGGGELLAMSYSRITFTTNHHKLMTPEDRKPLKRSLNTSDSSTTASSSFYGSTAKNLSRLFTSEPLPDVDTATSTDELSYVESWSPSATEKKMMIV